MKIPECINCDGIRKDLCQQLFEDAADVQKVVQGAYSSVSPEMLRDLPEEVLDGLQQFIDYSNLRALGFLMQIGCELTLEEVETRIELTKSNPDSA